MFNLKRQGDRLILLLLIQGFVIGIYVLFVAMFQGIFTGKDLFLRLTLISTTALSALILKYAFDLARKEEQLEQKSRELALLTERLNIVRAEKHDFNNHLLVVNGLLQLGHVDKVQNYLKQLVAESKDTSAIVRLNRPELVTLLQAKMWEAKSKEIIFSLDLGKEVPLHIRTYDLVRMLGNLLDNAVDAVEKATNKKEIKCYMHLEQGKYVIKVENSGPPIPEKLQKQIFAPGTTTKKNHYGMGMYILKQLTEMYGGDLKLESSEERGTKVIICLPAQDATKQKEK